MEVGGGELTRREKKKKRGGKERGKKKSPYLKFWVPTWARPRREFRKEEGLEGRPREDCRIEWILQTSNWYISQPGKKWQMRQDQRKKEKATTLKTRGGGGGKKH